MPTLHHLLAAAGIIAFVALIVGAVAIGNSSNALTAVLSVSVLAAGVALQGTLQALIGFVRLILAPRCRRHEWVTLPNGKAGAFLGLEGLDALFRGDDGIVHKEPIVTFLTDSISIGKPPDTHSTPPGH